MQKVFENVNNNWSEDSARLILSPDLFARTNLMYLQEIGAFRTLPGYFAEREGLDSQLIVLTLAGTGELQYENKTYSLSAGQFFWIDCNKRHRYRNVTDWTIQWMHCNGSSLKGFYEHWRKTHSPVGVARADMTTDFADLLRFGNMPSPAGEIECSRTIYRMVTNILLYDFSAPNAANCAPSYLTRILQYIDLHFKEHVTLELLADTFHVNSFHISRKFKECTGIGYKEYLIQKRMAYAKGLLKYTDTPIEEIADAAGFPTASHFIAAFKKTENTTPHRFVGPRNKCSATKNRTPFVAFCFWLRAYCK